MGGTYSDKDWHNAFFVSSFPREQLWQDHPRRFWGGLPVHQWPGLIKDWDREQGCVWWHCVCNIFKASFRVMEMWGWPEGAWLLPRVMHLNKSRKGSQKGGRGGMGTGQSWCGSTKTEVKQKFPLSGMGRKTQHWKIRLVITSLWVSVIVGRGRKSLQRKEAPEIGPQNWDVHL